MTKMNAMNAAQYQLSEPAAQRHGTLMNALFDGLKRNKPETVNMQDAHTVVPIEKPTRDNDLVHDGSMLGEAGLFSPLADVDAIAPVTPNNGKTADHNVILLNGIMTDVALQRQDMQALANTGANVIGIHNSTAGMAKDLIESVKNKLDIGSTPSIDTLTSVLGSSLEDDKPLRIIGHSQGAVIIAVALQRLDEALNDAGLNGDQKQEIFGRIHVETYGGAAQRYIDGPSYTHVVNKADLVPMLTGVGLDRFNPFGRVGQDADIKTFVEVNAAKLDTEQGVVWGAARFVDDTVHGPAAVYFARRNPDED